MKQLQYLFMTLSVLMLAAPAFAQTGSTGGTTSLVPIGAGIGMAHCLGPLRPRPGQGDRLGDRSACA